MIVLNWTGLHRMFDSPSLSSSPLRPCQRREVHETERKTMTVERSRNQRSGNIGHGPVEERPRMTDGGEVTLHTTALIMPRSID